MLPSTAREGRPDDTFRLMAFRSRQHGLRLWAAILAVYALLLHAPAMAAMGHLGGASGVTAESHDHGEVASGHHGEEQRSADTCCVVCGGGPCAVGPVGAGAITLPLPLARARRVRPALSRRTPRGTFSSWFEARGPPMAKP